MNLIASVRDTYICDLLEGRPLQRVDDEKNECVSGATGDEAPCRGSGEGPAFTDDEEWGR